MKIIRTAALVVLGTATAWSVSHAQGPFGGPPSKSRFGSDKFAQVFGKNLAFTATAHMTVQDPGSPRTMEMTMPYAVRDGKVRMEIDYTSMKGADMPANAAAQMKQMGMDRMIMIHNGSDGTSLMVYPGLQGYVEMSAPPGEATNPEKIDRKEIGPDTVEGHPCTKVLVTVTNAKGRPTEVTMWEATDLNNFPIKIVAGEGAGTSTVLFKDINQAKPAAALFEPDKKFKRYGSFQELMMSNMQRMMAE